MEDTTEKRDAVSKGVQRDCPWRRPICLGYNVVVEESDDKVDVAKWGEFVQVVVIVITNT